MLRGIGGLWSEYTAQPLPVVHVDGNVDPVRDKETIDIELILKDIETAEKRLDRLRKAGVIRAEVALLDRERLGVTLIVTITFKDDSPEAYRKFGDRMRAEACVSECYSIAGPADFVVIAHAPGLPEFERWAHKAIMSDAAIQRYDTAVVYSTVKYETAIPV